MLEPRKNAAIGLLLGALLVGGTAVQASAQATRDTSKAAAPTQDTSAYSAPARADTSAPAVTDTSAKTDSTGGAAKMDTTAADTSTTAGKKAWKKKHAADSSSAK